MNERLFEDKEFFEDMVRDMTIFSEEQKDQIEAQKDQISHLRDSLARARLRRA